MNSTTATVAIMAMGHLRLLNECEVRKTSRNSHIVWQIIAPDGRAVSGPPATHNGMSITGVLGWRTKRDAVSALDRLRAAALARTEIST